MTMAFLQEPDDYKNTDPRLVAWEWGVTGKIPAPSIPDIETQEVPAVTAPQDQGYMLPKLPLVRTWEHGMQFTRRANTLVCRAGTASLAVSLVEVFRQYYKAYRDVPLVYLSIGRLQEAMQLKGKEAVWYQRYLVGSHKVSNDTIVAVERGVSW